MKHLTDEELTIAAYGEGTADAAGHVAECAECSRAFADLKADLTDLRREEAPERDDAYGERVWASIRGSMAEYRPRRWSWLRAPITLRLSYAALAAALVAGGFVAGRLWEHAQRKPEPNVASAATPRPKQPIVVVVLGDHLDRSERLLVELKHVDAHNTDMLPPLRDEARSLLVANHICRERAEKDGNEDLENALDRLDHLLAQMANRPDGLSADAIDHLKEEMNSDGLLFEVRVLRSRVRDGSLNRSVKGGAA